ncbi:MAG TPA: Crp/Fnr family transcriptional regulator [Clostridia bacterium]
MKLFIQPDQELLYLLNCLKPKTYKYKRYDYITVEGKSFDSIGILLCGEASVSKENASGNRVIISTLKPGSMFGEMFVFSEQALWQSTVQAQKNSAAIFFERDKIIGECGNVCSWHKKLIWNMLKIISGRAIMLNKQVEYLTIKSIRGKISTYLFEQCNAFNSFTFVLPMNRKELAEFLNVSRPSLSREMARMRDEGIIDFHMSAVKIIDLDRLNKYL